MGYWIDVGDGYRVYESTIKDAYLTASKVLLDAYRKTNGQPQKMIKGYTSSYGVPIYNSARGKAYSHWVRFNNGSNPKNGYDACFYNKNVGAGGRFGIKFPKNW